MLYNYKIKHNVGKTLTCSENCQKWVVIYVNLFKKKKKTESMLS